MTKNELSTNSKYLLGPIDLINPKNTHDFQILFTGERKSVLEFGPATGYITKILSERGCRVTCIEINPTFAKQTEKFAEKTIVGDAERLDFNRILENTKYDVILMGDFLEHLREPIEFLKKLHPFIAPNGFLVCSIPNIAYVTVRLRLLNGEFQYESTGLLDETHLRFFTLDTILLMLEKSGYSITELHRVKEEFHLVHRTDLKNYSIPDELVEAILRDPEATTYQFVIRAVPGISDALETRKWLGEFPGNVVTERLKEILHYYKENLVETLQKKIKEKDSQIINLLISTDKQKRIINDLYNEILYRPADLEGLEYFGSLLENKTMTIEEIRKKLLESDERKRLSKTDSP